MPDTDYLGGGGWDTLQSDRSSQSFPARRFGPGDAEYEYYQATSEIDGSISIVKPNYAGMSLKQDYYENVNFTHAPDELDGHNYGRHAMEEDYANVNALRIEHRGQESETNELANDDQSEREERLQPARGISLDEETDAKELIRDSTGVKTLEMDDTDVKTHHIEDTDVKQTDEYDGELDCKNENVEIGEDTVTLDGNEIQLKECVSNTKETGEEASEKDVEASDGIEEQHDGGKEENENVIEDENMHDNIVNQTEQQQPEDADQEDKTAVYDDDHEGHEADGVMQNDTEDTTDHTVEHHELAPNVQEPEYEQAADDRDDNETFVETDTIEGNDLNEDEGQELEQETTTLETAVEFEEDNPTERDDVAKEEELYQQAEEENLHEEVNNDQEEQDHENPEAEHQDNDDQYVEEPFEQKEEEHCEQEQEEELHEQEEEDEQHEQHEEEEQHEQHEEEVQHEQHEEELYEEQDVGHHEQEDVEQQEQEEVEQYEEDYGEEYENTYGAEEGYGNQEEENMYDDYDQNDYDDYINDNDNDNGNYSD